MDTKTDRELIELAAKAVGAEWQSYSDRAPSHWSVKHVDGVWRKWNPLEDDGDALRLAVQLGIELFPDIDVREIHTAFCVTDKIGLNTIEDFGDDPMAATRRAIVMAAAKIGEYVDE